MKKNISSRHKGNLGGTLADFGAVERINVTVEIAPAHAADASVQHSAWMLVNLLCRLEGIVGQVSICCPKAIPLAGRIVPIVPRNLDFRTALLEGGREIGAVPIGAEEKHETKIVVGAGDLVEGARLYLWANGWCGGITNEPIQGVSSEESSTLPIGPYIAACLAAAEIFKMARLKGYKPSAPVFYSLWSHRTGNEPIIEGPRSLNIVIEAALAGVGAVGCACLHTLWGCADITGKMIMADNDPEGLDDTNLNRYVLFGVSSIGVQKATKASEILADASIVWQPHDQSFEEITPYPPFVISAVDRNTARAAIQSHYPARLFSASTTDLRAEVLRCGPPGVGACLSCRNPPEIKASDEQVRAKAKKLTEDKLQAIAEANGISLVDARSWIETGKCGTAGESLLQHLRVEVGDQPFAVGFVSVMAGTMLAAEVIKEYLPHDTPLCESSQRGVFQFLNPQARTNRANEYPRDNSCAACDPSAPAFPIWKKRYELY